MFEVIGIIAVWILGLALSALIPIVVSGTVRSTGEGLSDLAIGLFWARIFAFLYVVITVAWLAVT